MKRELKGLMMCFIVSISSFGQNKGILPKVYAFSREILPGKNPALTADENGNILERSKKPAVQYFIYVETAGRNPVDVKYIWLSGVRYAASAEKVTAPVIIRNNTMPGNNNDTIITASKHALWHIQVKDEKENEAVDSNFTQLLKKNEVVIEWSEKGKKTQLTLKEIKKLSPIALQ